MSAAKDGATRSRTNPMQRPSRLMRVLPSPEPFEVAPSIVSHAAVMAAVAGGALVGVATHFAVIAIDRSPVRVLVAEDAFEGLVVARTDVTVGAARPLSAVLARVDRKVAAIVVEAGRAPRARRMAVLALRR